MKSKLTEVQRKRFEKMIEEATVDCYGEDEALSGWVCTLEDSLSFPLKCLLLGEEVMLIGIDAGEDGGVLGVASKNKKKIRIPIQDVEVRDKKAKGLEWIDAYKYSLGMLK